VTGNESTTTKSGARPDRVRRWPATGDDAASADLRRVALHGHLDLPIT